MTRTLVWPSESNPSHVSLLKDMLDQVGAIWTEDPAQPRQLKLFLIRPEYLDRVKFFCDPAVIGLTITEDEAPEVTPKSGIADLLSSVGTRATGKLAEVGWLGFSSAVVAAIGWQARKSCTTDLFDEAVFYSETLTETPEGESREFLFTLRQVRYTEFKARYRIDSAKLVMHQWLKAAGAKSWTHKTFEMPVESELDAVLKFGRSITMAEYMATRREAAVPADSSIMIPALAHLAAKRAVADHAFVQGGTGCCAICDDLPGQGDHKS